MKCSKCGAEMHVEMVAEKKKRNLFGTCFWLFACLCTCGLILIIPALRGTKTKTTKYFVCNNCGNSCKFK